MNPFSPARIHPAKGEEKYYAHFMAAHPEVVISEATRGAFIRVTGKRGDVHVRTGRELSAFIDGYIAGIGHL